MVSQAHNHPKRKPFYKIKGPGPACIDISFKQFHYNYNIRDQVPPIVRAHMFQQTL